MISKREHREVLILNHVRHYGNQIMRLVERAEMVNIPESTFSKMIEGLSARGSIRVHKTTLKGGSRIEIVEAGREREPTFADRERCPRCETVNCQRHTASYLTTGRTSPVYFGR